MLQLTWGKAKPLQLPRSVALVVDFAAMSARRNNILWWLYQPWKWLVAIPVAVLATVVCGTLVVIGASIFGPKVAGHLGPVWARVIAWFTPVRIEFSGREHIVPGQSYVIVANHLSMYDIIALYGWLGLDFRWVIKAELRKAPFIGSGCAALGHVFVDRKNTDAARAAIDEVRSKISNGTCIIFFAEGTRSSSGQLLPFKKGAFRMAVDLDLPVLPITLRKTNEVLPNKTLDLMPGKIEMIFHEPIRHQGGTARAVKLRDKTRDAIASAL